MYDPNNMAQQVQGYGRGNDSMLVHMTPSEVGGLQQLAMAHGGSLSVNPQTGLPEAGFLEDILPTLLGIGLSFIPGVGPLAAAGLTGAGTAAITGDLNKGLMAGLSAFGGAALGGALGGLGEAGSAAASHGTQAVANAGSQTLANAGTQAATQAASHLGAGAAGQTATQLGGNAVGAAARSVLPGMANIAPHMAPQLAAQAAPSALTHGGMQAALGGAQNAAVQSVAANAPMAAAQAAPQGMLSRMMGPKVGEFATKFGDAAAIQGVPRAATTGAAAMGVGMPLLNAMGPQPMELPKEEGFDYEGPYRPTERQMQFRGRDADLNDSSEFSYFTPFNPYPGFEPAPKGYADGGMVNMDSLPQFQQLGSNVPPMSGGTGGAAMDPARALQRPGMGYRPGQDAEHNWNFRPVQPSDAMVAANIAAGDAQSSLAEQQALMAHPLIGKAYRELYAKKNPAPKPSGATPFAPTYRYNPMEQRVEEGGLMALAKGGAVNLRDGAFVVDARTVSELGNGSSSAGQEQLARYGGRPVRGPGDGVSDSVPAAIEGKRPARVARDEVIFGPKEVSRLGEGDLRKGARKLYALMDKAHKARKKAGRGQDTKVRKAI